VSRHRKVWWITRVCCFNNYCIVEDAASDGSVSNNDGDDDDDDDDDTDRDDGAEIKPPPAKKSRPNPAAAAPSQATQDLESLLSSSSIFTGTTMFIADPGDLSRLRRLLIVFDAVLSTDANDASVTHIVLPDASPEAAIDRLGLAGSTAALLVRSAWVTDSIAQNKRLPENAYSVDTTMQT